ncbi:hypothetical protein N9W22_01465 [Schleiferiaceae bacterium]|nr:hypothetical protein [Schleiferiaceae bacterium]
MLFAFILTYSIQFLLPFLIDVADYGLLKKVLLIVSYVSFLSLGSKDQWHLEFAENSKSISISSLIYGALGLLVACILLAVMYNQKFTLNTAVVTLIICHVIIFTIFQYVEILITYRDSKKNGSLFKFARETLLLVGVVVLVKINWAFYFVSAIGAALAAIVYFYLYASRSQFAIVFQGSFFAFPMRGFRMQIINLTNQFSLNGDKLLAAMFLTNADFGVYSILFLLPQGVLGLASQVGNYNLDKGNPNLRRNLWPLLFLIALCILSVRILLPFFLALYDVIIDEPILYFLALGVVSNLLWVLFYQNAFRRENTTISVAVFALGLLSIGVTFYFYFRDTGILQYSMLYLLLSLYKIVFYSLWKFVRRF